MRSPTANRDSRLLFWQRVREFAVPPPMIETATARRTVGDWAGSCAAARVDADLNLATATRTYGREFTATLRDDLRHLAPDLLRWHMPRISPDGLLRPGLTVSLARYRPLHGGAVHLVARTPPGWADAGQRISLALWDSSDPGRDVRPHPHPRPDPRFRLDLHRHLWDVRRVGELRDRSPASDPGVDGYATTRWHAEAAIVLAADGRTCGGVAVRLGTGRRIVLDVGTTVPTAMVNTLPVLPDAATWTLPDRELLRAGMIDADGLHPLIAPVLVPDRRPSPRPRDGDGADTPRYVACRGERHRIGVVDGVLVALDHDPDQLRREELLVAFGGPPLPCLRAIDEVHRHPESLVDVRARLDHGDAAGALDVVERLLGPDALLRGGELSDELETAALRRIAHGLFRAGLVEPGPAPHPRDRRRRHEHRTHPRHASRR
jgi:hypothetical protein